MRRQQSRPTSALFRGNPHIFLANFGGLVPHRVAVPTPASEIRVRIRADLGNNLVYLPFLGEERVLHGTKHGDRLEFTLPAVERGAAVWVQRQRCALLKGSRRHVTPTLWIV